MRNLELAAEEEDAQDRRDRWEGLLRLGWVLAVLLGAWGWWTFARGDLEKGALGVSVSLLLFGASWGLFEKGPLSWKEAAVGFLAAAPPLVLYEKTRAPLFGWGMDPAYWLSVHAGAVGEPAWSPLSYLAGEAACALLPSHRSTLLPDLSAFILSLALFLLFIEYVRSTRTKGVAALGLPLLMCWTLAVSAPFWGAATLGCGTVAALGFLLSLAQRAASRREEGPGPLSGFLPGLMWCVHPLWGLLGLLQGPVAAGRKARFHLFPFLVGLSPALWVFFRAGRFFPSWGGDHPFRVLFGEWSKVWVPFLSEDGSRWTALSSLGAALGVLAAATLALWSWELFRGRSDAGTLLGPREFWTWVGTGAGAVLFYSDPTQLAGPTALTFAAVLGGLFLSLVGRSGPAWGTFPTRVGVGWIAAALLLLAAGAGSLFPGSTSERNGLFFPGQHALNLLGSLGNRSVLVCEDPFEAAACRELKWMEPVARDSVILERRYLNRPWYVSQCVQKVPDLLFSSLEGPTDQLLESFVSNNRGSWDVQWGIMRLPAGWKGPPAGSTVLTQEFTGAGGTGGDPARAQYRYDLTTLPSKEGRDRESDRYYARYVEGFNELGRSLMDQRRYSLAIRAFERSAKLDPSFREPQDFLAGVYSKQDILVAAQVDFERIVAGHPVSIDGVMRELDRAQKVSNDERAVGLLDQIVRLNTELADAQYQLSRIYEKQGRIADARALLEASVRRNPGQIGAQLSFGRLMSKMGNRVRAEEAFRAVLGLDPQNKEAQVELWKLLNQT